MHSGRAAIRSEPSWCSRTTASGVWRIDLAPGETAGWHTHYLDYTTVVVEGDLVERPNADGTVDRIEVKPGAIMRWNQGTLRHALRNIGTKTFRNVIVEVKGRQTGA